MTTPSASVIYTIDEEHTRKVNEISALVFEELGRIEGSTRSGTADLSKSTETLQNMIDQIKADCTGKIQSRAREHNATALINRCPPPEILAEVILYAIYAEKKLYYARLSDLRSVSKYWNSVIESTPSIWTVLDCTAFEHSGCSSWMNFMNIAIQRSGSLPIHVTANAASSDNTGFELLLGVSSRWHDADLIMSLHSDDMLEFTSHASFRNLTTLSLRESPSVYVMDDAEGCIRSCGSFPSLRRFQTDLVLLRPSDGFAALQTLIIEPPPSGDTLIIPCITLPTYLDCCPNLMELRIFNVFGYDERRSEEAKRLELHLPRLHTLTIWDCDLGLAGSLLQALKIHSCEKLFVDLIDYEDSRLPEWQGWRQGCDVFELLGCFIPLIQTSCKETNCVELVVGPEQFQLRTHTSESDIAGATQSVVIGLADVAKPQTAKALLDLLGLKDRAPPFEVHLWVSMNSDPNSDQVRLFREEILLPILEWSSVTSLSVDMDEPNARVFLEALRGPLGSGFWPVPNVTTLSFDDMDVKKLSEDLRLLCIWRYGDDPEVAPLQSMIISSRTQSGSGVFDELSGYAGKDVLAYGDPEPKSCWKDSLPWTTF